MDNGVFIQAGSVFVDKGPGATVGVDLALEYVKILPVLMSKNVGNMVATIANATQMNSGTAIYYKSRRNFVKNYKRQETTPDPVKVFYEYVNLDQEKILTYTFETLDLTRLGVKFTSDSMTISEAFLTSWVQGRAKSFEAYIHAKATMLAVEAGTESGVLDLNVDSTKTTDWAELKAQVWAPLADLKADFMGMVSSTFIGIDAEDLIFIVSPKLVNRLILTVTNYSDSARGALLRGEIGEIAGLRIQVNNFLGKKYSTNTFDQDETFDFSSLDGILLHKEALGVPWNMGQLMTTIQPNTGNPNFIHKFLVNSKGGIVLRPQLVKGIKYNVVVKQENNVVNTSNNKNSK